MSAQGRAPVLAVLLWIGLSGVAGAAAADEIVSAARARLRSFADTATAGTTAEEDAFQAHYGLPVTGCVRRAGVIEVDRRRIFVQTFEPSPAKGGVLVAHGYYDHAGALSAAIRMLVRSGYAVLVYDQPGHGLSDGPRADIDDFARYVAVFDAAEALLRATLPPPYACVAHSLGCAAVLEHLVGRSTIGFRRVVLVAPLIRSSAWRLSRFGNAVAGTVVDSLPRTFRSNSADEAFLASVKADPLQARHVPLHWVDALGAWNKRVESFDPAPHAVAVLQGTDDATVDWEYNLPRLRELFPRGCDVHLFPDGGHQLLNEGEPMRTRVFETLRALLDGMRTE